MLSTGNLKECTFYLCKKINHYLVSCTKELYPEIAKNILYINSIVYKQIFGDANLHREL